MLPPTKARIQSIAKQQGISESKVVRALVDKALQFDADMQYGAMIRPVIEDAIGKRMRARDNRLAALLVRVAFDAGQTRNLVTNLLNIQPEMTSDDLKTILTESARSAKGNITRRTPQIAELIEEVEQWMRREGENETK